MIVVGFIAVLANGISAYMLHSLGVEDHHHTHHHVHEHHHHHGDANITSAYLHMLADTLVSVGVVIAGIAIYFFKIYTIDSILTIIFSIYIIKHSFPLFKRSFLSLLDANILNIPQEKLEKIILSSTQAVSFHDLHIHSPNSQHDFISFQLVLDDKDMSIEQTEEITGEIKKELQKIGFDHILIQVQSSNPEKLSQHCEMVY